MRKASHVMNNNRRKGPAELDQSKHSKIHINCIYNAESQSGISEKELRVRKDQ